MSDDVDEPSELLAYVPAGAQKEIKLWERSADEFRNLERDCYGLEIGVGQAEVPPYDVTRRVHRVAVDSFRTRTRAGEKTTIWVDAETPLMVLRLPDGRGVITSDCADTVEAVQEMADDDDRYDDLDVAEKVLEPQVEPVVP